MMAGNVLPISSRLQPAFPCTISKLYNDPLVVAVAGAIFAACMSSPWVLIAVGCYVYSHLKEIIYETSLICSVALSCLCPGMHPWWSKIDEGLYVGRIPLHDMGHFEAVPEALENNVAILSMLEPFELEDRYMFSRAVSHADWKKRGISTLQLAAEDFCAVSPAHLLEAIQFIREMRAQGKNVYVHCKAGVGRSATVMACYLLAEGLANGQKFTSAEEVIQYVQSKRPNVMIYRNPGKSAIEIFYQYLQRENK